VILTLGTGYGHVSERVSAVVLTAMILTSLLSPYLITGNDRIARWLVRPFARGPGAGGGAAPAAEARPARDIVLLGHFRIAHAVLDLVEAQAPQLKGRITLVDYDANRATRPGARVPVGYGDLANPDALEHRHRGGPHRGDHDLRHSEGHQHPPAGGQPAPPRAARAVS
jgi:hypothetical protein